MLNAGLDRPIMTTSNDIHNEAMDYAEYALSAKRRGDTVEAAQLFAKSLELERKAIDLLTERVEPEYSILHRSAATLALDCGEFRLAEQIASKALAGDPPEHVVWQLRSVTEQVTQHDHLRLNGLALAEDELQMSLAGSMIGPGLASLDDFIPRADGMRKLMRRVSQHRNGQAHTENGSADVHRLRAPDVLISPLRAGSVAVTLKIGSPVEPEFPEIIGSPDLVDETLDVIELIASSDSAGLASKCPDEAYRRNFVQLVRNIAPDGDRVTQVGFTAVSSGKERTLPLTTTRAELSRHSRTAAPDAREEAITGRLLAADGTSQRNQSIQVVQPDGTKRRIKVPAGMMDDIVRPLWNEEVTALCTVRGKTATLVEVEAA